MNQILATAQVSSGAIGGMVLSMIFAILGPILLLIVWRIKKKCNLMPALVGAVTFIVAALVLENIPKYFLFSGTNTVSEYVLSHAWSYALAGGLLAGIFEECGRFVAFRFFLKKHTARETSLTYGIGHGGIECIVLLGLGMVSNLSMAFAINSGALTAIMENIPAEQLAVYESVVSTLTTATFGLFLLGIWERIFAVLFHIALSVLVFAGVTEKSKFYLFPLAILLHAGLDIFAALYQFGMITLPVTELFITLFSCVCAFFAYRVYRSLGTEQA
ncbi:MAG: YhfC family glutamic-type intramembrane protease [Clostridiales bacterium]|nr:YhfC family glutamic-type intramembrane protease [Roseburia sp.]MDD7637042.1 YhfC family glutamic-type intramembrane protease [Clostridiales bacterium]MDY4111206.1 YhfC family glutamic-type intramembrane protease [Roseburia sp.]